MRWFVAGFDWFLVLYFGIIGTGGAILSAINGGSQNFTKQYRSAGKAFGRKYGTTIHVLRLGVAALGTATGHLPGTRPKPD
jgi:hypothetical protein